MDPFKNIQKQENETKTFFWYMYGRKLKESQGIINTKFRKMVTYGGEVM